MRFSCAIFALAAVASAFSATRPDYDTTLVKVEAVVRGYGDEHIIAHGKNFEVIIDQKIPTAFLEIRDPQGPFDRRLSVRSEKSLPDGHLLREVGAILEFTVERKYLVGLFLDPSKPRDTPSLTVEKVKALKRKNPSKASENRTP